MKVGIVYSTQSKMIRRIILPDQDSELDHPQVAAVGESLLVVDRLTYDVSSAEALVEKETGQKPKDSKHAVVDKTGKVIAVIHADPDIDNVGSNQLVAASADVTVGDSWAQDTGFVTVSPISEPPVV